MSDISIKTHLIGNLQYDILFMDTEAKRFSTEVAVRVAVGKNNADNKIQIDFTGYTDKETPFVKLSIVGVFDLSEDLMNKSAEEVGKALKEEGFPLLYKKLQDVYKQILRTTNAKLPLIPDIEEQ